MRNSAKEKEFKKNKSFVEEENRFNNNYWKFKLHVCIKLIFDYAILQAAGRTLESNGEI